MKKNMILFLYLISICSTQYVFANDVKLETQQSAIYNGTYDQRNDYEYVVYISSSSANNGCSGIAITKNIVLTATHCLLADHVELSQVTSENDLVSPRDVKIYLGSNVQNNIDPYQPIFIAIPTNDTYPELSKDLAILVLEDDLDIQSFVPITKQPLRNTLSSYTVIGYGKTEDSDNLMSKKYYKDVEISTSFINLNDICDDNLSTCWTEATNEFNTDLLNIMDGDSGGPVISNDSIIGIVHSSTFCEDINDCIDNYYETVYLDVYKYNDFIENIRNKFNECYYNEDEEELLCGEDDLTPSEYLSSDQTYSSSDGCQSANNNHMWILFLILLLIKSLKVSKKYISNRFIF